MSGIDRHTGKLIGSVDSGLQSIEVIFTTRIGERVMRRHFGAGLAELLGRATTPALFAAWQMLVAIGIDLWDVRWRVRGVYVSANATAIALGQAGISVEADWRPRALAGDFTVDSTRFFTIRLGRRVSVQQAS
jgi:phage baseplate assembly protein W